MKTFYSMLLSVIFSVTICAQQFCGALNVVEPNGGVPIYNESLQWNIPVVFHIILSSTNEGDVSDAVIQQQMSLLNQRYSGTDFSFYLLV